MTDKHSFDSYIYNNWAFESEINNKHSFDSYIRNTHTFGSYPLIEPEPILDLFWYLNFISRSLMMITNVLSTTNLSLDVSIPEINLLLDSSLITVEQSIQEIISIIINAPTMTPTIRSSQSLGVNIVIPLNMGISMGHLDNLSNSIILPSIQMNMTMSALQYYLLNYYDASLLSDLDSNLLSDMDRFVPA